MKTLAYYALHYGTEYLEYSLESIYPYVDHIVILYTPTPSYGYQTDLINPDSEASLKACCERFKDKIEWKQVWASTEGQHRKIIENYAERAEYDIVLAVDADEVWDGHSLAQAIEQVKNSPQKFYRVPFIHLWKDFNHVCTDPAQPMRFIKMNGSEAAGDGYIQCDKPVYHFGYAISDELMQYKWGIHGHKAELRSGWMDTVWKTGGHLEEPSVHPANGQTFWIAEKYDKEQLPKLIRKHPRYV